MATRSLIKDSVRSGRAMIAAWDRARRCASPRSGDSDRVADIPIWVYDVGVARAATTADAFNAVAEPRRREILDALASGERPVNDLVRLLGLAQPQVSKHLRVLREVGVVDVRDEGRQRVYRVNGRALKPIHDWVKGYERMWSERFEELDAVLDDLKRNDEGDEG